MFIQELQTDCNILLERALQGKTIACFGIDGNGQYGHSDSAQHFKVYGVSVMLEDDQDNDYPTGVAIIHLDDYDANVTGHLMTDQNFQISLNKFLKEQSISVGCWSWGDARVQLQHCVVLNIDVEKLIHQ